MPTMGDLTMCPAGTLAAAGATAATSTAGAGTGATGAAAGAIAYGLGVKNCGAINVEFYTGIGTVLDAPELPPPELDMSYLEGRRVLLVDDVADSGRTLALAVRLLQDQGADVRSAVIYTKPTTIVQPDYSFRDTALWIDFPWSAQGTVVEEDAGIEGSA